MNETKEITVTMNCEIRLGADPVKNSDAINKALKWGFELIGLDEQRANLQYANGNIFDSNPERLDHVPTAAALPEEKIPSVKISTRRPAKSPAPQVASGKAETGACCAFCEKRVRSDGKPCAGCAQRVCSECKVWPKGLCPRCHTGKDNDASKKSPPYSIKPTPTEKKMAAKPALAATMCPMCKVKLWTTKCPVCGKNSCTACYDKRNDSCKECASIE